MIIRDVCHVIHDDDDRRLSCNSSRMEVVEDRHEMHNEVLLVMQYITIDLNITT
jgi:hypothetical protein